MESRKLVFFTVTLLLIWIISSAWAESFAASPPEIKLDTICITNYNPKSPEKRFDCLQMNLQEAEDRLRFSSLVTMKKTQSGNRYIIKDEGALGIGSVGFVCSAPYPVEWVYTQEKWISSIATEWIYILRHVGFATERLEDSKGRPRYLAMLQFDNFLNFGDVSFFLTGEYTCQPVSSSRTGMGVGGSSKISVFLQQDVYSKVFLLSGKTVGVYLGDNQNGKVIFPCNVVNPEVQVFLLRKVASSVVSLNFPVNKRKRLHFGHLTLDHRTNSTLNGTLKRNKTVERWESVELSNMLTFNPALGFVYHPMFRLPDDNGISVGSYACVTRKDFGDDDEVQEYVKVIVKAGMKPRAPPQQAPLYPAIMNTTIVNQTEKLFSASCCSNSLRPPQMFTVSCYTRTSCEWQKRLLIESPVPKFRENGYLTVKDNCIMDKFLTYWDSVPINIKCVGDGLNIVQTYVSSAEANEIHDNWNDVNPQSLIILRTEFGPELSKNVAKNLTQEFYKGQKIQFFCSGEISYFSYGTKFKIGFVNGTSVQVEGDPPQNPEEKRRRLLYKWTLFTAEQKMNLTMAKNISFVSCLAPVINSEEWVEKTMKIKVKDPEDVKIAGESSSVVVWMFGEREKELECEFSGDPLPKVEWFKDAILISKDSGTGLFKYSEPSQNVSALMVKVANYDAHGIYLCVASNVFQNQTKIFHVFVRASETMWTVVCTALGVGFFAVVVAIVWYKTWRQRQQMKRLGVDSYNAM